MSKVILVTGAGRGLGTDIAREALAAGHQVMATGRRLAEVEDTIGGPQDNLRLIEQRNESEARLALETQRQLTAAAVRDDPRQGVVGRLAQLLDGAAFLLSVDGRVEVRPTGPRKQLADVAAAGVELTRIRSKG